MPKVNRVFVGDETFRGVEFFLTIFLLNIRWLNKFLRSTSERAKQRRENEYISVSFCFVLIFRGRRSLCDAIRGASSVIKKLSTFGGCISSRGQSPILQF